MNTLKSLESIIVEIQSPFEKLLKCMSSRGFSHKSGGLALVVDENRCLVGVVTDADFRKFIAIKKRLPTTISQIINKNFVFVQDSISVSQIPREISKQFESRGWNTGYPVRFVPVVDDAMRPVALIDVFDLHSEMERLRDQIVVIGLGYVGLTFALAMVDSGRNVIGVDSDDQKIESLRKGVSTLYEQGLEELLVKANRNGITFLNSIHEEQRLTGQSFTFVLCLPTPISDDKKSIDTSLLYGFLKVLIPLLQQGDTIVLRSTVPIGTGRSIVKTIEIGRNWNVGSDFYFVQAPERTAEGNAINELHELPQIVGGGTNVCVEKGISLFDGVAKICLRVSSIEVAEMVKIVGNAYRDYTFAFSNQIAEVAKVHGIDIDEVIQNSNLNYPRSAIPLPSPGVGGPCLTKDSYMFDNETNDINPIVIARQFNESVPYRVVDYILKAFQVRDSILCMGIAFKGYPSTDDLRNSSNLEISRGLERNFGSHYEWDAVVDSRKLRNGLTETQVLEKSDFQLIAILNNHPDNSRLLKQIVKNFRSNSLSIFDPWRLVQVDTLSWSPNLKSIQYLNSSLKKFFERGR